MRLHSQGIRRKKLRTAGIILGVLFILWLPIEDTDIRYVMPLAAGLCAWLGARYLVTRGKQVNLRGYGLVGLLTGLMVSLAAVGLISFKGGLHGHGFPDFALVQVREVLYSTLWWGAGGLMVGLAAGLWVNKPPSGD